MQILESKGDIGLFSHPKPQITTPQEFRFATDDRLGQPALVVELFDKVQNRDYIYIFRGQFNSAGVFAKVRLYTVVRRSTNSLCTSTLQSEVYFNFFPQRKG